MAGWARSVKAALAFRWCSDHADLRCNAAFNLSDAVGY
jgi:hypothetical protein